MISAGNAGQVWWYAARQASVPCDGGRIETAPQSNSSACIRSARSCSSFPDQRAWQALDDRAFPGIEGTFVHPFDDDNFIAGHGTMGVGVPRGFTRHDGGDRGNRRRRTDHGRWFRHQSAEAGDQILGAEPETAAPAALSFQKGSPQVFENWKPSFVDGAGGKGVFWRMWERMKPLVDDYFVVSLTKHEKPCV